MPFPEYPQIRLQGKIGTFTTAGSCDVIFLCSTLFIDEILPVIICQNTIIVGSPEIVNKEVFIDLSASLYRRGSAVKKAGRSEEHTSELQSRGQLVCRL